MPSWWPENAEGTVRSPSLASMTNRTEEGSANEWTKANKCTAYCATLKCTARTGSHKNPFSATTILSNQNNDYTKSI